MELNQETATFLSQAIQAAGMDVLSNLDIQDDADVICIVAYREKGQVLAALSARKIPADTLVELLGHLIDGIKEEVIDKEQTNGTH